MRRIIAILLPLCLCAGSTAARPTVQSSATENALKDIDGKTFFSHIQFLADDQLEGRGTATHGYRVAAAYVAAQFAALGLRPAGERGSFYQSVPLQKSVLDRTKSSVSLIRGGNTVPLHYGDDYVTGGDYLRNQTAVSAPVVFVGFGVTAPELEYDDYASVDVRGKIIAMLSGAPPTFPNDQRAYYSSGLVKEQNAVSHGAIGILTFRTPVDEARAPWDRAVRQSKLPGMRWLDRSGKPMNVSAQIRGGATLSHKGAVSLFARAPQSLETVFARAKAGKPQAFALPVEARIEKVSQLSKVESPNVVAVLPGSDPQLRGEYVIYTAHLDHLGISEPVRGDSINNGAYDNASGIASLIEMARAFRRLTHPPRRSVVFLAVTGEEKGLLGSDYFAHHPTVPKPGIVADINMDMFLMLYPVRDVVAFGAEHSSLGYDAARAAEQTGLRLSPDPVPEEVVFIRSDQYSFIRQGIPSLFITSGRMSGDPHISGKEVTTRWLKTTYHSPSDDLNQRFDLPSAVKFTRANFLLGYEVANAAHRPTWNKGDFFGRKFGHTSPGATTTRVP